MSSFTNASGTVNYQYRADGMRTKKSKTGQTDWFSYDGQMPVETAEVGSSATTVTKNSLGARGIDRIERVGSSTTVGYPLYDGHGNMVATLAKSGSSFTVNDQRTYDAWGVIRSGNTSGNPKGRYVASLGHVDDDESGLTYMRARYYEAVSGRFASEDTRQSGENWFAYCDNNPVGYVDKSGNSPLSEFFMWAIGDMICTKFLGIVPSDHPAWKAIGSIIENTVNGITAIKLYVAIGASSDAKCRAAMMGIVSVASVAFLALAFHQLTCLSLIIADGGASDDDTFIQTLGDVGSSQAGFNPWDYKSYLVASPSR